MHRQQETKETKSKERKETEVTKMFLKTNYFKALIKKSMERSRAYSRK